jgi:hypothetical protein
MIYYFVIVPLDPAYKAGLTGHAPVNVSNYIFRIERRCFYE